MRVARALLLLLLPVVAGGCEGTLRLPGQGEPCGLLCSAGLFCSARGYCEKSCRCDGGLVCTPGTFDDGCAPGSMCVVTTVEGRGTCATYCGAGQSCPVGEGSCSPAPEDAHVCLVDGFVWVVPDGGADR